VYHAAHKNKKRGGVVNTQENPLPERQGLIHRQGLLPELRGQAREQQGFTTADILWALGIWSVIVCLSPVIVFYVLMVA
jgi:hypothetical protein